MFGITGRTLTIIFLSALTLAILFALLIVIGQNPHPATQPLFIYGT